MDYLARTGERSGKPKGCRSSIPGKRGGGARREGKRGKPAPTGQEGGGTAPSKYPRLSQDPGKEPTAPPPAPPPPPPPPPPATQRSVTATLGPTDLHASTASSALEAQALVDPARPLLPPRPRQGVGLCQHNRRRTRCKVASSFSAFSCPLLSSAANLCRGQDVSSARRSAAAPPACPHARRDARSPPASALQQPEPPRGPGLAASMAGGAGAGVWSRRGGGAHASLSVSRPLSLSPSLSLARSLSTTDSVSSCWRVRMACVCRNVAEPASASTPANATVVESAGTRADLRHTLAHTHVGSARAQGEG